MGGEAREGRSGEEREREGRGEKEWERVGGRVAPHLKLAPGTIFLAPALSSDEKALCLSVRLSNARIVTKRKRMHNRSVQIFIPYERSFSPVL